MIKGMKYAVGENFSFKDEVCSGGSITLENYIPIFNATVIDKLNEAEAEFRRQTPVKEFEITNDKITEAADVVLNNECDFAIGTDFNGSTRESAFEAGIIGYKPTYGLISRFGIYPVASALDNVGIYARDVKTVALVANALKGIDSKDMNTFDSSEIDLTKEIDEEFSLFHINELSNNKFNAKEEKFNQDLLDILPLIHECIMSAEMTTTLANLTGIPFGKTAEGKNVDEMMINFRSKFTPEVKKHLIVGCYSLLEDKKEDYYYNSLRLRGMLFNELNKLFAKYDALISDNNKTNRLIANLCGYPSITAGKYLITGKQKDDAKVIAIAKKIEKGGL